MGDSREISSAVIKRLPRYRRFLRDLLNADVDKVSSGMLGEITGYTASQIRQDFNNFGGFGQQGYGYNVKELYEGISAILGLDTERHMVIVGAGNIGRAIAGFPWSKRDSFVVDGIFDREPDLIGQSVDCLVVRSMEDLKNYLRSSNPDVGVIATNRAGAQEACDILVEGGVKGIWAFAPGELTLPDDVHLQFVHLNDSLHELLYRVTQSR